MEREASTDVLEIPAAAAALTGLTSAEAERRLSESGPNAITEEAPPPWRIFFAKFWGPVPWMLELALLLQLGLGAYIEAAVIGALLLFNATLGFIQEGRAGAALAALKQRLAPFALVCRDGEWVRRPASELVPGDAIRLPLGALVPADAAIVSGSVMVDQSMLTGESVPVDAATGDAVYAGSLVRRGQAIAQVTATGPKTYFGRAAELVRIARSRSTEQAAIFGATRNLAIVNGTVAVLIVTAAYAMGLPSGDLIRLALTALLATIPLALPATFTLSAAFGAQILARRGVLLTRLSAAHEAAAMDVLCADKTGTLTRNTLEVVDVVAMPGFERERVLALAALVSSEADQDPIDAAIRAAAAAVSDRSTGEQLVRFVPFDPATKTSEAYVLDRDGNELHITKGAFEVVADVAQVPADARRQVDDLAGRGHRVIAVAVGPVQSLRLAGLVALSDPPREDSAGLVATLRDLGVRTIMVTGDSAVTAGAIARKVGIGGAVCPPERFSDDLSTDEFGVFARVVPEEKYRLVKALQSRGRVVGMCGDGTNDAPALRQAQIGIAVSSATDVAKAAASLVMTEPGLAGIVFAVREGRIAFQRLLAFTFNMLVKKTEIVLFLAIGLGLTGHAVMTPVLMVLMLVTNDFLAMSLTTDRASPAQAPSRWRMRNITAAALILGFGKLAFSTAMLALGAFRFALGAGELQTLAFVTLVFGNQAVLYVVRERRHLWSSKPSKWVVAASVANIAIVAALALSGTLMQALAGRIMVGIFCAAIGFALMLDQIKLPVMAKIKIE
jgi:H+-transporting ATPase